MGYKHSEEEIIKTGSELFRKRGYNHVGVNQILSECGITKGSFYNFFDSKEEFAKHAIEAYGKSSLNMIRSFLSKTEYSPLNRLKNFYTYLIVSNVADGLDAGCLVNNMSIELGGYNPGLSKVADEQFNLWLDEISMCVAEGQEQGEIITDMPSRDIAEYVHAGLFGALSRMKVNKDRVYLDKWFAMTFNFICR